MTSGNDDDDGRGTPWWWWATPYSCRPVPDVSDVTLQSAPPDATDDGSDLHADRRPGRGGGSVPRSASVGGERSDLVAVRQAVPRGMVPTGMDRRACAVRSLNVGQPLDHYDFKDTRTFQQRVLVNTDTVDWRAPVIFFYTGNEGDITLFANNTGYGAVHPTMIPVSPGGQCRSRCL